MSENAGRAEINVVAAVLRDEQNRILIAQRPPGKPMAGFWEFPGGKIEAGETAEQALDRECQEELGVQILASKPLIELVHEYPDRTVRLLVRDVLSSVGVPSSREGQQLLWDSAERLGDHDMLPADRPILTALRLPSLYAITPADSINRRDWFLRELERALDSGLQLLQLRWPDATDAEIIEFGREVLGMCRPSGCKVLMNESVRNAAEIDADGVHLKSAVIASDIESAIESKIDRTSLEQEWSALAERYLSVSCHSRSDLIAARQIGADFAVLGPVEATTTHPGVPPLGWGRFEAAVDGVALPVYALGGMAVEQVDQAREHGAQGIAAISSVFGQT